ncbi:hypothetical protein [Scytonema hofmannii]|uniref:hypothetical protein n=1 Tax=Scytonema hofmannii TaxID=34078 RepID=UPI001314D154|nr:hypothetical protein [Scytonema hofmannii]
MRKNERFCLRTPTWGELGAVGQRYEGKELSGKERTVLFAIANLGRIGSSWTEV